MKPSWSIPDGRIPSERKLQTSLLKLLAANDSSRHLFARSSWSSLLLTGNRCFSFPAALSVISPGSYLVGCRGSIHCLTVSCSLRKNGVNTRLFDLQVQHDGCLHPPNYWMRLSASPFFNGHASLFHPGPAPSLSFPARLADCCSQSLMLGLGH
jgi:hypothetical protein